MTGLRVSLGIFALLTAGWAVAQDPQPMPPAEITSKQLETELEALEKDTAIADAAKDELRTKYKQAIEVLQQAETFQARGETYRKALTEAPKDATQARNELSELEKASTEVQATSDNQQLQQEIDTRKSTLAQRREELSKVADELTNLRKRAGGISERQPAAEAELRELTRQITSAPKQTASPSATADQYVLRARQARLTREIEMLKQEQASAPVRENWLKAAQALLERKIALENERVKKLETAYRERLVNQVSILSREVNDLARQLPADSDASELLDEVKQLNDEFADVVNDREAVRMANSYLTTKSSELTEAYQSIRDQLENGGGGAAMALVLFDLERRARNANADVRRFKIPSLGETRLALIRVEQNLRNQRSTETRFDSDSETVKALIAKREEILSRLEFQLNTLIKSLTTFAVESRRYVAKTSEIHEYVVAQAFWMRSSEPIGLKTLKDISIGIGWVFSAEHSHELITTVQSAMERQPIRLIGLALLILLAFLNRPRARAAIMRTGEQTRRISTDRFSLTLTGFIQSFVLASPIPLALAFCAWCLTSGEDSVLWIEEFASGFEAAAWVTLLLNALVVISMPGGIAQAHLGWKEEYLLPFRRTIQRYAIVFVPSLILTYGYHLYGVASSYFDGLGRLVFIVAHLWTTWLLWRFFWAPDGLLAALQAEEERGRLLRYRYVWVPLVLGIPLLMVVLACAGYLITAIELSLGALATVSIIVTGMLFYALAKRWFMIKHRRMALQEALERRRARLEAESSDVEDDAASEVISTEGVDDLELDLDEVGIQTQALLRVFFGLAVAIVILVYWSRMFPFISILDSQALPLLPNVSVLDVIRAAGIVVVTLIVVRNLPGLLDLAILRAKNMEPGTRHAISTLCQYGVFSLGLILIASVIKIDWAQLSWLAAALGVGLGFGLQEIVANFVCGIILLFEQPIRVGDIVTVNEITGTVTKIHMRATTITNWDRQDFVVPNKNLITGTILNWTLSAPLNRVVIPVGVAYGTDTDEARQILLNVAKQHPNVLEDPPPSATFEAFADSSLNLILRAYLPDMSNRIATISELLTEIDREFAAAGIEIPFPQQDLHIRDGGLPAQPLEDRQNG